MKKQVGGNRLGSGNKLTASLHAYGRSTHDLGKVVRTTAATGTLIPIYTEFVQKGDVWEIDLDTLVRTHATNGPIFGTWKLQLDVFTSDVRLYNRQLHNNTTGIGTKMDQVKFPLMALRGQNPQYGLKELNQQQVAPDSLLAYLGIRGFGKSDSGLGTGQIEIRRNAIPLLTYWDIYKEYYTNKQEEIGYVISPILETGGVSEVNFFVIGDNRYPNEISNNSIATVFIIPGRTIGLVGKGITAENTVITIANNVTETPIEVTLYELRNRFTNLIIEEDGKRAYLQNCTNGFVIYAIGEEGSETKEYFRSNGVQSEISEGLALQEFPLSNIDDARIAVFDQPNSSPLTIGWNENKHQITYQPYKSTTGQTKIATNGDALSDSNCYSLYTMAGLGIKTYQSDHFNNWLGTTWIDHVNNISSVEVTDGSFTMDALNLAKKLYKVENDIVMSGNTYDDWYEAVYGMKVHGAPEMPVYRGGMSSEIVFDEVVSSSQYGNEPLGTLGGRGVQRIKKGGRIRFEAQEHGWIIILASFTPRIDYYQGNKWWTKLETMDDIHKPMLDGIGFQELLTDQMAAWDTEVDMSVGGGDAGEEKFKSAGKQPSWTHYMTNTNEIYGNFAREEAEGWMVLSRRYNNNTDGNIEDLTTYIDPTKFNYPFAYVGLDNQPFWLQVSIGAEVRRIMAANQMPNF